jgi:hypothetical protein
MPKENIIAISLHFTVNKGIRSSLMYPKSFFNTPSILYTVILITITFSLSEQFKITRLAEVQARTK